MNIRLDDADMVKALFAENPGVVIQVRERAAVESLLTTAGVQFSFLGQPSTNRQITIETATENLTFDIDALREAWYESSYLLDCKQSLNGQADARYRNYKEQPLQWLLPSAFMGKAADYIIDVNRRTPSGVRAAIIREKGTNGEREMAYMLYMAGFDVKDVTMTDLVSGRETLDEVNFIVFCGGFSNSDVLGSAKGWAGAFLFNPKAKETLDRFYARPDTLSLGICNGCQLLIELGLINPDHDQKPRMQHNDSRKFESGFLGVTIPENRSVLFGSLAGAQLGVWVAHGEGKFALPYGEGKYHVAAKYSYADYPANPNGSDYAVAALASEDGRHIAMMPHLERAFLPWQCPYYSATRRTNDEVTPWIEAFVNARKWVLNANNT
jgi:phosphoribosylformylglycinamidine synthase